MKKQAPKILQRHQICESRLFSIEKVDLIFSNGEQREYERFAYHGRGSVMVMPITKDNELLLVREYAVGVERYELGFVKGIVDLGEDPLDAANRELKEEIGFGAKELTLVRKFANSPGYSGSWFSLVLARDLYPETLEGDEPEPLEKVVWPLSDIDGLLEQPDFTDARAMAGVLLLERFLKK